MDESYFFGAREETCVHFRLAGEGGNKRIDRCAHRSMKPPPGGFNDRFKSPLDKKQDPSDG